MTAPQQHPCNVARSQVQDGCAASGFAAAVSHLQYALGCSIDKALAFMATAVAGISPMHRATTARTGDQAIEIGVVISAALRTRTIDFKDLAYYPYCGLPGTPRWLVASQQFRGHPGQAVDDIADPGVGDLELEPGTVRHRQLEHYLDRLAVGIDTVPVQAYGVAWQKIRRGRLDLDPGGSIAQCRHIQLALDSIQHQWLGQVALAHHHPDHSIG
ncbi:hypothetical protein D3C85_1051090 [compost metagenome]